MTVGVELEAVACDVVANIFGMGGDLIRALRGSNSRTLKLIAAHKAKICEPCT